MSKKKITMHQAIFYQLWKNRKKDPNEYIPIWKLIGEIFIEEFGVWAFVSYEVAPRTSELFHQNPDLFERQFVTGKSGSRYYAYRIGQNVTVNDIKMEKLLDFYKDLKTAERNREIVNAMKGV